MNNLIWLRNSSIFNDLTLSLTVFLFPAHPVDFKLQRCAAEDLRKCRAGHCLYISYIIYYILLCHVKKQCTVSEKGSSTLTQTSRHNTVKAEQTTPAVTNEIDRPHTLQGVYLRTKGGAASSVKFGWCSRYSCIARLVQAKKTRLFSPAVLHRNDCSCWIFISYLTALLSSHLLPHSSVLYRDMTIHWKIN